jgi:outer membrane protein assembly factor BamB
MKIFSSTSAVLVAYGSFAAAQPTPETLWTASINTNVTRSPRDVFFSSGDSTLFVFCTAGSATSFAEGDERPDPEQLSTVSPASILKVNPLSGVVAYTWEVPPSITTAAIPHGISSVDVFPKDGSPLQQIVLYTNDSNDSTALGRVIAYSPVSNSMLWDFELTSGSQRGAYGKGKPSISSDGTAVYVCQETGLVTRINMATGISDWQVATGLERMKGVAGSPDGTRVFAATAVTDGVGQNRIIEMDTLDGSVLATYNIDGEPQTEPLSSSLGDCVYLQNDVTGMQCFGPNNIVSGPVWTSLVSCK